MKPEPRISVITPCLNSVRFMEQAVQSVLAQNYPNFEHIVVDGGSTDGTIDILRKYPHLVWRSEKDAGQSHAMNKGFTLSTGEIIVYLNADDFFQPEAFRYAIGYLDRSRGISFIAGACNIIDQDGNKLAQYRDYFQNVRVDFYGMLQWWKYSFPNNPSTYFYFREVQQKVGPFDQSNHYSMDYDFLLRSAISFPIHKVDNIFSNFRYMPGTKTYQADTTNQSRRHLQLSHKYWKFLPWHKYLLINLLYVTWSAKGTTKSVVRRLVYGHRQFRSTLTK